MLRFHPNFSPLKVFNRGMAMLAADGLRLVSCALMYMAVPHALITYLLLRPFFDGTFHVHSRFDPEYLWRMGAFFGLFCCIEGLNYTLSGQLLFDQGLGQRQSLRAAIPAGLFKFFRAAWIYLPALILATIGHYTFILPGLLMGYLIDFTAPSFILEKKTLRTSWREGLGYLKGHVLATASNFILISLMTIGTQKCLKWLMPTAYFREHFIMATCMSAVSTAVLVLFAQAWMTSLYFTARNLSRTTPEGIAQVFD